jgi:hypothetical protein
LPPTNVLAIWAPETKVAASNLLRPIKCSVYQTADRRLRWVLIEVANLHVNIGVWNVRLLPSVKI